jgi:hypothetical protein
LFRLRRGQLFPHARLFGCAADYYFHMGLFWLRRGQLFSIWGCFGCATDSYFHMDYIADSNIFVDICQIFGDIYQFDGVICRYIELF